MEQLSMFDDQVSFPQNYDDIQIIYEKYIYEGEKDDDVFSCNEIKGGKGRSYFFYGKKVMEFHPEVKTPYIKIIDPDNSSAGQIITSGSPVSLLDNAISALKERKRQIFRSLIVDTFGCCNDFKISASCKALSNCSLVN